MFGRWSLYGAAAVIGATGLVCPYRVGVVSGHSMEPTYRSSQVYLMDRAYYRTHALRHGDVVILRHRGQTLIKRVFALPGDRFYVWEADRPTEADTSARDAMVSQKDLGLLRKISQDPEYQSKLVLRQVPAQEVYVLGDNLEVSEDSRTFGPVFKDEIVARVLFAPQAPAETVASDSDLQSTARIHRS